MTQAIKQWIEDQSEQCEYAANEVVENRSMVEYYFAKGLTKGIEIAEGFAEFVDTYMYNPASCRWISVSDFDDKVSATESNSFTTSQLLEIYLKTLEP